MHLLPTVLLLALAAAAATPKKQTTSTSTSITTTTTANGMGAPEDDSVNQPGPAPRKGPLNHALHGAIGAATSLVYKMLETWAHAPRGHEPQRMPGSNQPPGAGQRASLPGQNPAQGVIGVPGPLRDQFQPQNANPNSQPNPGRPEQLPSSPGRDPPGENSNAPDSRLGSAGRSAKVSHDRKGVSYPGGSVQWTVDRKIGSLNSKLKMYMNERITPLTQWQICMKKKLDPKRWTLMDYFKEDLEPEVMDQIKQMEDDCIDEVNAENKAQYAGLELEREPTEDDSLEFSAGNPALQPSPNPLALVSAWAACVQKCAVQHGANLVGSIPCCFNPSRCRKPFSNVNPVDAALRAYQEHKKHINQTAATAGVALAVAMLTWLVLTSLAAASIAVAAAAIAAGVGIVKPAM